MWTKVRSFLSSLMASYTFWSSHVRVTNYGHMPGPVYHLNGLEICSSTANTMLWWARASDGITMTKDMISRCCYTDTIPMHKVPKHVRDLMTGDVVCHICGGTGKDETIKAMVDRFNITTHLGECVWCEGRRYLERVGRLNLVKRGAA